MKIYEITLNSGYESVTTVSIGGRSYDIRLKWLTRDESFEMTFGLQGMNPMCTTKLTTNSNLIATTRYMEDAPKGFMTVVDTMSQYEGRITYDEFGSTRRYRLIYGEEDGA